MTKEITKSTLVICLFAYLIICLSATLSLFAPSVHAQASVRSDNYVIQMPNFNSGAGIPTSNAYRLDTTIGQTGAGLYSSNGYLVRSGFQYIHSIIPFSFAMSNFLINFGNLVPGVPSTLTSTITVSSGGAGGYNVKARENDYLKSSGGQSITDTLCDAGTCSESTAGVWSLGSTYGFGFNMSGNDVPADFVGATYYRHFANSAQGQGDKVIMGSPNVGHGRSATITYKINISGVQPAGTYRNTILYTAIPSY